MIVQVKKRKAPKTAWKKGFCPNPRGRGAAIPISKETRKYTTQIVADIYNELTNLSRHQLRSITIDAAAPAIKVIVAKALLRDMRNASMDKTEVVLARIIGHVPTKQEIGGMGGVPLVPPTIVIQDAVVAVPPAQEALNKEESPTGAESHDNPGS